MNPLERRAIPALLVGVRLVVGATLLWAGIAKIPEPDLFAQTVRAYAVLPLPLINPFAIVVPWIEALAGLFLVLGLWTRSGALASLVLLAAFAVALGINIYRGADLSCGCFGLDGGRASLQSAMVRDLFLLSGALVLFLSHRVPFSLDRTLACRAQERG